MEKKLDILLDNCEVYLILSWSENCVLTSKSTRDPVPAQRGYPAVAAVNNPTDTAFKITAAKLYVPVVGLSVQNDRKFLEQWKTGFRITIKWKKYRSEISNQVKNDNLNNLIEPTFTRFNKLVVSSFKNEDDRTSFSKYYVPKIEIKYFNVVIDQKIK